MSIKIIKQYLKELSIISPNSPEVFTKSQNNKPDIQISIDIDAKKLSDLAYEVTLKIKAEADSGKLFKIFSNYAGIFTFDENDAKEDLGKTLLIDCPNLLFPFLRNIISSITTDSGFSALMLDPIDFQALYEKRKESITVN